MVLEGQLLKLRKKKGGTFPLKFAVRVEVLRTRNIGDEQGLKILEGKV